MRFLHKSHSVRVILATLKYCSLGFLSLGYGNLTFDNPPPNNTSPLGMNTNEALEVDASLHFVDLFRLALPFDEAHPWFTKGDVQFDKNGWPKNLNGGKAGTRFLSHILMEALPEGEYKVLYDGEGKLNYGASAKVISQSPGKDIIKLVPMKQQYRGKLWI